MHSSSSCSLHKHCKPNCVDHNQFICSLRKYQKTNHKSTKTISHINSINNTKDIGSNRMNSTSSIRPFRATCEDNTERKNQQSMRSLTNHQSCRKAEIESYLLKVEHSKEKKKGKLIVSEMKEQVAGSSENKKLLLYSGIKDSKMSSCMVEEKQFKELEVNVDRISQIIDMFNKKIGHPEQKNSTQNLKKGSENTVNLKPFIISEEEESLSNINSFNCTLKENTNYLLSAELSLNNLSQNFSKPIKGHKGLNYQMNNIADKTIFSSVYLNKVKA